MTFFSPSTSSASKLHPVLTPVSASRSCCSDSCSSYFVPTQSAVGTQKKLHSRVCNISNIDQFQHEHTSETKKNTEGAMSWDAPIAYHLIWEMVLNAHFACMGHFRDLLPSIRPRVESAVHNPGIQPNAYQERPSKITSSTACIGRWKLTFRKILFMETKELSFKLEDDSDRTLTG